MATQFLMLVNSTYEEKVSKKGRGGVRSSGRDKREESEVAYGDKDMAISYLNRAKVEKSKINGNTDASNKLTSINNNISADPTLMLRLNLHES